MDDIELKRRLRGWAKCYAGAQFLRLGYADGSALLSSRDPVDPDAEAVEVDGVVRGMELCGRWREARVLRAEYFMAGLPECEKLQRLKRIGLSMHRVTYYDYLRQAKAFVMGALALRVAA